MLAASSSETRPSSIASTRTTAAVMLMASRMVMASTRSVASMRPSARMASMGPRVVAVKAGIRDRLASSRVCSSASMPRPCIQSGEVSKLEPFFRSTVMLNASPVNKFSPRLMFSLSPISPPTFTVRA